MATITGADQRTQLLERGYCVFANVLSSAMLAQLRVVTDRVLAGQTDEDRAQRRSQGSMFTTMTDPLFADLITAPAALGALVSLRFPHPCFSDGYIISKPPHSPQLFWHYDWFAWDDPVSFGPLPPQVFLMYYLTDTTRENGCLRVIPGSHLHHTPVHDLLLTPHSQELSTAENLDNPAFQEQEGEVDVPVRAGNLLIGDARLLHASHANGTDTRRTLITLWYQPDLASLPERVQAQMAKKAQRIPETWPAAARETLAPLMARYTGDAPPYERTLYRRADR